MAGYIIYTDGTTEKFHMGRKFGEEIKNVDSLELDNTELEHVQTTMSNLPTSNRRIVTYFGDHAKFILKNW